MKIASDKIKKPVKAFLGAQRSAALGATVRSIIRRNKGHSDKSDMSRLEKIGIEAAAGGIPLRLHFGCGPRILKEWINFDVLYDPHWKRYYADERDYPKEIRGTRSDLFIIDISEGPLPLPDNCVSTIFHEDFIEHTSQRTTMLFLAETFRVLKPGGVHRISTPDLKSSMKRHGRLSAGWKGVHVREWDKHGHINILTPAYLKELAEMIGYSRIEFNAKHASSAKNLPAEKRPGNDREMHEQIFCDLIK